MDLLSGLLDLLLHLDRHLRELVQAHGAWVYAILFAIVFLETGVVVTPFLPGDSLLFVGGAVAAAGGLDAGLLALVLFAAAVAGDSLNYSIGRYVGPRVFRREDSLLFRQEYVDRTRAFFERHGGKAIVLARFVPIIRTYAPFVAGIGAMDYRRFLTFNVAGAALWVGLLVYAGYFFGNLPFVRDNLTAVILAIVFLSILPAIVEYWRAR
ncbi:MAG TPA: DedA family protein [Burkholderiales bacterium]|nr:DedA family protein [Burkholderiales bacterium]